MQVTEYIYKFIPNFYKVEKLSGGHINETFKVCSSNGNYVLQVVNSSVFPSVEDVMHNATIACEVLKSRGIPTLEYLTTDEGKYYYKTSQGEYIRMCKYVENSISLEFSNDLGTIYSVGKGFGEFCHNLTYVDSSAIVDTIPNFHNTEYYLNRVFNVESVPSDAENILEDLYSLREFSKLTRYMEKSITHNDTRFNNILLDRQTKKPLCVVDLDTIMHGYPAYDFADGVRSACKGRDNLLDIQKFEAYFKGYTQYPMSVGKSTLVESIVAVTLELSARYLYEYLTHGNYFNLHTIEDNLTKAILNLNFSKDVLSKMSKLTTI
jgi:Ser/Thr protein kinase RdoA (MazF antagonist)